MSERHETNQHVIAAIRTHHAELAEQLHAHTARLLDAAGSGEDGPAGDARTTLHRWFAGELLPHAQAEEQALYAPAADAAATRLLVQAMVDEHRALRGLVAELARADPGVPTIAAAASAATLFDVHLAKENDLLLPAMDEAGVDLAAALAGMHEILGRTSRER